MLWSKPGLLFSWSNLQLNEGCYELLSVFKKNLILSRWRNCRCLFTCIQVLIWSSNTVTFQNAVRSAGWHFVEIPRIFFFHLDWHFMLLHWYFFPKLIPSFECICFKYHLRMSHHFVCNFPYDSFGLKIPLTMQKISFFLSWSVQFNFKGQKSNEKPQEPRKVSIQNQGTVVKSRWNPKAVYHLSWKCVALSGCRNE